MNPSGHAALGSAERVRMDRVDQLVALGEAGLDDLLALLTDPSWSVRRAVVAGLAAIGQPAVAPLCDLLRTKRGHEGRLAAAVDALVASIGEVEPAVLQLTQDSNPAVVSDGAQILGRRRTASAMPVLIALTRHPDDNVSVAAVEALGRIGGRAAVESLIDMTHGENFFRTFPAIDVLGRSGDPRVVGPLADLLDHPHLAPEAARALGRTGAIAAAGPLISLLTRPGEALLRVGVVALAELIERHAQRYGEAAPVEHEIRRCNPRRTRGTPAEPGRGVRRPRREGRHLPGAGGDRQRRRGRGGEPSPGGAGAGHQRRGDSAPAHGRAIRAADDVGAARGRLGAAAGAAPAHQPAWRAEGGGRLPGRPGRDGPGGGLRRAGPHRQPGSGSGPVRPHR